MGIQIPHFHFLFLLSLSVPFLSCFFFFFCATISSLFSFSYTLLFSRPLVLIAGSYDQDQGGMGGFQEWPQVWCHHDNILCCCLSLRLHGSVVALRWLNATVVSWKSTHPWKSAHPLLLAQFCVQGQSLLQWAPPWSKLRMANGEYL